MGELGLALQLVRVRLALRWWLWRQPLPALLARLTPAAPRVRLPRARLEATLRRTEGLLTRMGVTRVGRRLVPDTCLYRALGRYVTYRSAGVPVRFVTGVRAGEPELLGHAWLELGGAPLGERLDPRLHVTFRYPGAGAGGGS